MLQVQGKQLNVSVENVLDVFKEYLQKRGIERFRDFKDIGKDIMTNCPIHKNGQERKPSFGIHKDTGMCHCFSCGYTASLGEMISNVLGYDDFGVKGEEWLLDNFINDVQEKRKQFNIEVNRDKDISDLPEISELELDRYRYIHPYMYKRKLTDEIINLFDVGYDKLTRQVTFPTYSIDGSKCIFIGRRSVDSKFFVLPKGENKPIYALDKVLKSGSKEIVICESIFNALTCWVYGKRCAVALFGTGSSYQLETLKKLPFRHIICAFDPDDAGRRGMQRLLDYFKDSNKLISYWRIPEGKDINDLTKEEFDNLQEIPLNY